jgi:Dolichyl-phosphate-mannose-protein mannosyltransferase
MNALLTTLLLVICAATLWLAPTLAPAALLVGAAFTVVAIIMISRLETERQFLLRLFAAGLLIRMIVGLIIFWFGLQAFFGGDANTYDFFGFLTQQGWHGNTLYASMAANFVRGGAGAWGMLYLVGGIYEVIGRNPLAIQFINAVIGAATAVLIFSCAMHIFRNIRVARVAAILTAFFPSLVLWSSQGLKDGPIVFLLALSILATLKLGEQLTLKYFFILSLSLISLLSMRFYIFYMMVAAVAGSLAIGMQRASAQSVLRQSVVIIGLGLALTWFGVIRYANLQFERYGNLEAVQRSRADAAQTAKSGFATDVDVSTSEGALTAIPIGLVYLLFAPFPWQLASLRQIITLPEMIVWWCSFPLLVMGIWFAIKYRLRQIFPIIIFTIMLSLAYSVFQGNVGTAYRQRAQLLVFYFIFVAVGFVLVRERREEKARREVEQRLEENRRRSKWGFEKRRRENELPVASMTRSD